MGTVLIVNGILLWFWISLTDFIFFISKTISLSQRFRSAILINLRKNSGREFGIQYLKMTGLFWVLIGVFLNVLGERFIGGVREDLVLGLIILVPVWIGASIVEKRKKHSP